MVTPSISVVLITKNEADKIACCLESVKWADEIVIVDDMSSDDTIKICEKYTDRIIRHKSNGDFDNQRNIGIDNSQGDWILQMDADEIVTDKAKEGILKVLKNPSEFVAYKFRRKNLFLGHFVRYGGWYDYMTKLFKKDCARYIGKSVHETLRVDGKIGVVNADIEHYPFKSIGQFIERQNFYTSIEAKLILEERGILNKKEIKYNLQLKPLKLFWKFYLKKRGFRDGMYGLVFSLLYAWLHFLKWAKYWEQTIERDEK